MRCVDISRSIAGSAETLSYYYEAFTGSHGCVNDLHNDTISANRALYDSPRMPRLLLVSFELYAAQKLLVF